MSSKGEKGSCCCCWRWVCSCYSKCSNIFPQVNRWWSLLAGLLMELGAGSQYTFSVYSSNLRFLMGFSIREVDMMGTTLNICAMAGFVMSFFFDMFGPKPTTALAGVLCFSGYFMIYVSMKRWIFRNTHWLLYCVFYALIGTGGTGLYSAGLATNVKNFDPKYRGRIVGLCVCFFGLSAGVFGFIYKYLLKRDCFLYVLFMSFVLGLIPFICFWILNVVKKEEKVDVNQVSTDTEPKEYEIIKYVELEEEEEENDSSEEFEENVNIELVDVRISKEEEEENEGGEEVFNDDENYDDPKNPENEIEIQEKEEDISSCEEFTPNSMSINNVLGEENEELLLHEFDPMTNLVPLESYQYLTFLSHYCRMLFCFLFCKNSDSKKKKKMGRNYSPITIICTLDFHCVFFIFLVGIGSGLIMINTIHEFVISLSPEEQSEDESNSITGTLIIVISVFNTFGRLFFGFFSDLTSKYLSRTGWLVIVIFLMSLSQFCFAFSSSVNFLYFFCPICAMAYGGMFTVLPTFISERYGLKYLAVNLTVCQLGCAAGSFLIATLLQSHFYELGVNEEEGNALKKCFGVKCFQPTFLVTTCLCLLGAIVGLVLHASTRDLYQEIHEDKEVQKSKKKEQKKDDGEGLLLEIGEMEL